ncbi:MULTISPECIES: DUF6957 family protein [Pseudomonas syringae group]|uniref:DUF6957 family protein n=1 Tax=Pseudomonas syringae group TaxID=136849 RepID=UPI000A1E34CA|nr:MULTISPECIES: hypothetical protein [Pseudomonas syringae group]OSN64394.1 hypothetical protein BV349_03808 [Pseudomonas syringae pv. actinidiae]OSN74920.1 hypothetical protein BV351_04143 [Pseudomonas syringae pv. actinidiae]
MHLLHIAEAIALDGEPLSGASEAEAELIQSRVAETGKAYCAAVAWVIIDVLDVDAEPLAAIGRLPIVLFTHSVLLHSTGDYQNNERIKTGYATNYDGRGIFETSDTIFVLVGQGFRKSVSIKLLNQVPSRSWAP